MATPPIPHHEALLDEREWLRRLARRLVTNSDEAEDLVQETWLASWLHPPRSDSPRRPWLARVARNLSLNHHREATRRSNREQQAARPEVIESAADVCERFDIHRSVVEVVTTLPEPYRTTILLRYWDDLPPRAIAVQLGVPVE